jgi:hypothetical protein
MKRSGPREVGESFDAKRCRPLRGLASFRTNNLGLRYRSTQALRSRLLRRLESLIELIRFVRNV